jgi:peroxiredoxin
MNALKEIREITDERRNQRAPNFTLHATNGLDVTLYKFAGKKRPLLYFPLSLDDEPSKLFARNIAALRDELNESDGAFLPIVQGDAEVAKAWADENAKGYSVLLDTDGIVRKKYYEYLEVDQTHALFVLLDIYCAPLVISHAANALELMSPDEMTKWLNVLVCACSE